jgi:hypothetical protein
MFLPWQWECLGISSFCPVPFIHGYPDSTSVHVALISFWEDEKNPSSLWSILVTTGIFMWSQWWGEVTLHRLSCRFFCFVFAFMINPQVTVSVQAVVFRNLFAMSARPTVHFLVKIRLKYPMGSFCLRKFEPLHTYIVWRVDGCSPDPRKSLMGGTTKRV